MPEPRYDVFVSYAHADDERPAGAEQGWVTTLAAELRKVLRRKLGVREARVHMDHQLAGNEGWTEGLLTDLGASRTLLLLMSPGYLKSRWCQWELGRFLEALSERDHRDHVFLLELEPTERAGWHPTLQDLTPIRFWHREFEDKAPRLLGFPVPTAHEDSPYWRNLNELAHLIARQLEETEPAPPPPRARIWLAEPTEDLLDEQESLAATLRQLGFEVVPKARLPRDGREPYLRSLQECLEGAVLGVQLLGPREGRRPAWSDRSFVALQAAAGDEAARARGLRLLRWRPRELALDRVTGESYKALLTGGRVLAQGIEELKQEIIRACESRAPAWPPSTPRRPSGQAGPPRVYVNADAVDRDRGRQPRRLKGQEGQTPYPGLRPFERSEAEIFFGREAHTGRLLEILKRERFLAVLGLSGAGKSSLVRAGLLPGLAASWLGGAGDWRIAILRPGERPFRRLAEALSDCGALGPRASNEASLPALEAELRRGPFGLAHLLADARRGATGARPFKLLVLVDQFEEIFRYAQAGGTQADESEAFVQLLLASRSDPEAEVYAALTMRTDFLGHCVRFLELPEAINHAQYLIPRLTRPELERAITGPVLACGGDVDPALTAGLINSLDQDFDQLPLLQHALARMWSAEPVSTGAPRLLTAASLEALGGLQGALSAHANEVYGRLSVEKQVLVETLFRAISLLEGTGPAARSTRRPQLLSQIAEVAERDWRDLKLVVSAFAAEGVNFLHHGEPLGPESMIDISHEALIRQWPRLRAWAEDEAERATELRQWRDRAALRKKGGELLSGADLARAVEWRDDPSGRIPKAPWAARYLGEGGQISFAGTLAFIAESEAAESERREQEAHRARTHEQLERSTVEAHAMADQARANAAARERDQKRQHTRLSRAALATAVLASVLAGVALTFHFKAKDAAKESLARQLAGEVTYRSELEPDRALLLAVAAFETAALPVSDLTVRQAFANIESLRLTLRGHNGSVATAAFNPNGRTLLTASSDKTARMWDAASGQLLRTLRGHESIVTSALFSPDGRTVLTASGDQTAKLWDAATGQSFRTFSGHSSRVTSAVFSPDGRTVLTASADKTARLWDANTGKNFQTLRGHDDWVTSAVFSPDGRIALTASADKTARIWDAKSGQTLQVLRGHSDIVTCAVFSPDGRIVLTASKDQRAKLWNAADGQVLQTFRGHSDQVASAVFSPDGQTVLTASWDKTARIWDAANGRLLQLIRGHDYIVSSAVFSPDGQTILSASADETARLWNTAIGRGLRRHDGLVTKATFSPDGRTILTASSNNTAQIWDAASGRSLRTFRGHDDIVNSAVFGPDGQTVLTASKDRTARIWDATNGQTIQTLHGHSGDVSSAVFSSDGQTILTASSDETARIWDPANGRTLQTLRGHKGPITSAVFSSDGQTILTASWDETARIWDPANGRTLQTLRGHKGPITSAVLSTDGRNVLTVSKDGTARIWDLANDGVVRVLSGHDGGISSAVLSPDGRTILTASSDGTARLWDAATGQTLQTLSGHTGDVSGAAFSPDGQTVIIASSDGTARLWPCNVCQPTRELAAEILRRVGRHLTPEERAESDLPPLAEVPK